MKIKDAYKRYLELTKMLLKLRKQNHYSDSPEEDDILEEMDDCWYNMTKQEHNMVKKELKYLK